MVRELGPGGTERQAAEVARFLDRKKFTPHVVCFHEGIRAEELRRAGVKILRLHLKSFFSTSAVRAALEFRSFLRREKIRLVHTFDYPMNCFGVPVARWARIPIVLSSQRAHRGLNPPHFNRMLRITARMVNAVVTNCDAMRR